MKKRLIHSISATSRVFCFYLWIGFILGTIVPMSGCRHAGGKHNDNAVPPQIRFEQCVYDFGEAEPRKPIEHVFKFKNVGQATLRIKKLETSCTCTATLLNKEYIPSGGEGEIKVTYEAPNTRGKVIQKVDVHCDDPDTPVVSLQLRGIVKVPVSYFPHKLYFPSVRRGDGPTRSFRIWDTGDNSLRIEKVETSSELLETQVSNSQSKDGLINYTIDVRLSPQISFGKFVETITVYTNNPKKTKFTVPVEANVVGHIRIWPERLFIGMVKPGETVVRELKIDASGNTDFKVEKVESSSKFVKSVLTKQNEGGTYKVQIQVDKAVPSGTLREKIAIHNNSPGEPVLSINLFGLVEAF